MDFNANDPARVAEGFGLSAQRVNTPEELSASLQSAFSGKQPVFIDVVTEPEVENLPPVYTWLTRAEKKPTQ